MQFRRFKQVDVFTQRPFFGNPVAVVLDAEGLESEAMQRIAAWTNLSETTFVLPPSSEQADYRLRIFSPRQELPFAGHPTVGSAHAVIESGFATVHNATLRQECLAGVIDLSIEETRGGNRIFLKAPEANISAIDNDTARVLASALGRPQNSVSPTVRVDVGVAWLVAELADSNAVAALQPDLDSLRRISAATNTLGTTVFGKSDHATSALHVRSFAPALGVPEDPVCGSGNASVGAFLIHTGQIEQYGSEFLSRQGLQIGRDGHVFTRVAARSVQSAVTQSPASMAVCERNKHSGSLFLALILACGPAALRLNLSWHKLQ
jgi:PhzF family phenazine biosynthesis protein